MQNTGPPRKRPGCCARRVYSQRTCLDCPAEFLPRSSQQRRCSDCQQQHERKLGREKAAAKRRAAYKPRYCLDCSAELPPPNGSARPRVRCVPCSKAHKKAHDQERSRASTASGTRKVYDQRYRATNGEQIREASRRYRKAHPETDLSAIHRRRQRRDHGMNGEDRALSAAYRRAIRNDPCFYCGSTKTRCHVDHFFPLSKGGTDHWWNLVPACRRCNLAKSITCGTAFLLAA